MVPYYPISAENMKRIVRLKLERISNRMKQNREVDFIYDDSVADAIAKARIPRGKGEVKPRGRHSRYGVVRSWRTLPLGLSAGSCSAIAARLTQPHRRCSLLRRYFLTVPAWRSGAPQVQTVVTQGRSRRRNGIGDLTGRDLLHYKALPGTPARFVE